jgi:transcriptional regulator with XRE-family HTH domain
MGRDVPRAIAMFLGDAGLGRAVQEPDVTGLLNAVRGGASIVSISAKVGADRTTVARWLRGTTEPSLPLLLAFVDATTHRLVDFVAVFVDPEKVPTVREAARTLQVQRNLAFEEPLSHAVMRALELDVYCRLSQHRAGVVANVLGIDVSEETRVLRRLADARLIRKVGRRWAPTDVTLVDTRASPSRNMELKAYWATFALQRLRRHTGPAERNLFSYNLFAISRSGLEEIRQLHIEYYERVRAVVAASSESDCVVLMNQQLLDLKG